MPFLKSDITGYVENSIKWCFIKTCDYRFVNCSAYSTAYSTYLCAYLH